MSTVQPRCFAALWRPPFHLVVDAGCGDASGFTELAGEPPNRGRLIHDLVSLRLVSADLDSARRVYASGRVEQGSIASEAALDALFSPAGQHQLATIAFLFALAGMALLLVIRPYFEPR